MTQNEFYNKYNNRFTIHSYLYINGEKNMHYLKDNENDTYICKFKVDYFRQTSYKICDKLVKSYLRDEKINNILNSV